MSWLRAPRVGERTKPSATASACADKLQQPFQKSRVGTGVWVDPICDVSGRFAFLLFVRGFGAQHSTVLCYTPPQRPWMQETETQSLHRVPGRKALPGPTPPPHPTPPYPPPNPPQLACFLLRPPAWAGRHNLQSARRPCGAPGEPSLPLPCPMHP